MAIIAGLEEQKAALKRVKQNLTEVTKINESLTNIKEYFSQAAKKEFKIECEFLFNDESLKRIKVPVVVQDESFVINALREHKDKIVGEIKADSSKFHISLSPQEETVLISDNSSEN